MRTREDHMRQLEVARSKIWDDPQVREKIMKSRNRPLDARMAKFVINNGPDACWGWKGSTDSRGYGKLGVNKRLYIATHIALKLDGRERPSLDHVACHTCDNPPCTNPGHLWWGTRKENTQDSIAKGRFRFARSRSAKKDSSDE